MKNQNFGAPPREVILVLEQSKSLSTFSHNIHLSEEAKSFLNKVVEGTWTQRSDGKIDVDGSVYADGNEEIQNFLGKEIFFGVVTGDFNCAHTRITSLEGAPREVGGSFYCRETYITSLKGAPEKVGRDFDCSRTRMTSLEGGPKEVGGIFDCSRTRITSLEGRPKEVGSFLYIDTPFSRMSRSNDDEEEDYEEVADYEEEEDYEDEGTNEERDLMNAFR